MIKHFPSGYLSHPHTVSATGCYLHICIYTPFPILVFFTTIMGSRSIKIDYASEYSSRKREESASSKASSAKASSSKTPSRAIANLIQPFPSSPTTPHSRPQTPRSPFERPGPPKVPAARYNMALSQAKVKSVLSGDSLILTSINNPDGERTLSLAYCTSPHLKKEGDEPFAFEARDALRKLVVGKKVQFKVLYSIPNTKRDYGIVFLEDGRRLPEYMVEEGWAKLRDDAGRKEDSEDALTQLDNLRLLEARARSDEKGLWQTSSGQINVQHDMGDPTSFLEEWKGKSVGGLVERVLSGDRMLVRLILSPTEHVQGSLNLAPRS
jgi:staphylococcal nuclease domain-containing protein 1